MAATLNKNSFHLPQGAALPRFLSTVVLDFAFLFRPIIASPLTQSLIGSDSTQTVIQDPAQFLPNYIPLGVIAIALGFLFCFWGAKWFKVALFLAGFYVFASIAFFILESAEPNTYFSNRNAVYYGVVISAGIVGGLLTSFLVKLGIFAIGCLGGFSLALWILALNTNGAITSVVGQKIFIAALALIGGCVTLFVLMDSAVKIFTSIAGAYSLILGIDMFAHTGFKESTSKFIGSGDVSYNLDKNTIIMLVAVPILAILGMIVQFRLTARGKRSGFFYGK